MFRQFLKITFHNLWRNKGFSILNIAGLAGGMTVALFIGLWVADELSYDRFHEKHDRLYQVKMTAMANGQMVTWNSVPLPLAEEFRQSFPEVKQVAECDWGEQHGLKFGDKLLVRNGFLVHGDFLKMFSFPLLEGEATSALEPIFKKYNPAYPFNYRFADAEYNKKFSTEVTIGKLAALFAGLAIFISCLGIFGLSAYLTERRSKEIGIRKVLGASVSQLWAMLSGEFVGLVIISCVVAAPLAFYFLKNWLGKFDYSIGLNGWMFAAAGVVALLVTLSTVSFQSIKAALANPVESLRSE